MHLVFEKTSGRFRSNCNILTLAWMPYYNETKFRQALFDYHQRQLLNLPPASMSNAPSISAGHHNHHHQSSNNNNRSRTKQQQHQQPPEGANAKNGAQDEQTNEQSATTTSSQQDGDDDATPDVHQIILSSPCNNQLPNGRLNELQQRFACLRQKRIDNNQRQSQDISQIDSGSNIGISGSGATRELQREYGQMKNFGWLVVGNIGRIVGVTLTSIVTPPIEQKQTAKQSTKPKSITNDDDDDSQDLIQLADDNDNEPNDAALNNNLEQKLNATCDIEKLRPDRKCCRNNYNLRGHLDEVILCKWNELYQKLATVDGKGNVLIWCKVNEKFTIQTPFYNRTKSVADFQWSNDGKTALICYTDSFILVGSSTGQRHWHSMLNLDDYHITCGSWTPNDEQLLLGVSNGNIVVIDLPRSDLIELVVSYANIRTMSWSNSGMTLAHLDRAGGSGSRKQVHPVATSVGSSASTSTISDGEHQSASSKQQMTPTTTTTTSMKMNFDISNRRQQLQSNQSTPQQSPTTGSGGQHQRFSSPTANIVAQRRLSRDCSVFSRYRFCSQPPNQLRNHNAQEFTSFHHHNQNQNNMRQRTKLASQKPLSFTSDHTHNQQNGKATNKNFQQSTTNNILAIDYANNTIELFEHGLDDPTPQIIQVNLESYIMQWSSDGQILAVAGFNIHTHMASSSVVGCIRCQYLNTLKFYNRRGELVYERPLRYTRYPITAFTWAHENERLFVATGPRLHCAKVFFGIPKLSLLSMSSIQRFSRQQSKADVWKLLTAYGVNTQNAIDWQSRNCPIDLQKIYRQVCERLADGELSQDNHKTSFGYATQTHDSRSMIKAHYHFNSNIYVHNNLSLTMRRQIDEKFCSETIRQPFESCLTPSDTVWLVPKHGQRIYCTLVCYTSDQKLGNTVAYQYNDNPSGLSPDEVEQLERDIKLDKLTGGNGKINGAAQHQLTTSSDHYKIFVLYVEFAGSYIPILRARRVGILKPEFVIFDPQTNNNELNSMLNARRQHKVADISQRSTNTIPTASGSSKKSGGQLSGREPEDRDLLPVDHQGDQCSNLHEGILLHAINDQNAIKNPIAFGARGNFADIFDPRKMIIDHSSSSCNGGAGGDATRYPTSRRDNCLIQSGMSEPPLPGSSSSSSAAHEAYLNYMMSMTQQSLRANQSMNPISQMQRNKHNVHNKFINNMPSGAHMRPIHDLLSGTSVPILTEKRDLVRIKSNIWGTKFKILNECNSMIRNRSILGSVVYKASLLHLQPRQIFLNLKDMSNYCALCSLHHHTPRATSSSSSKHVSDCREMSTTASSGRDDRKPVAAEPICLLDAPLDYHITPLMVKKASSKIHHPLLSTTSSSSSSPNRVKRKQTRDDKDRCPNEKIVMTVGEGLRIAPRLESNQVYKMAGNDDDVDAPVVRSNCYEAPPSNHANDQLLTLALDHSNQVRVAMTSPVPPATPKRASSLGVERRCIERDGNEQTAAKEKEALASDKTLKSIKDITQMIVDLSERSKRPEVVNRRLDDGNSRTSINPFEASPNKLIKTSNGEPISPVKQGASSYADNDDRSMSSQNYIPPDTPVHRPRRRPNLNPRLQLQLSLTADPTDARDNRIPKIPGYSRSANTTPIRRRQARTTSSRHPTDTPMATSMKKYDDSGYESASGLTSAADELVLQPPPPRAALSRRLSTSAKRFFDESLRSLSFTSAGGGDLSSQKFAYSNRAASCCSNDVESEDCEPLVRQSRKLTKKLQQARSRDDKIRSQSVSGLSPCKYNSRSADNNNDKTYLDDTNNLLSSFNNKLKAQITQRFSRSSSRSRSTSGPSQQHNRASSVGGESNRMMRQQDQHQTSRKQLRGVDKAYQMNLLSNEPDSDEGDSLTDSSGSSSSSSSPSDCDDDDIYQVANMRGSILGTPQRRCNGNNKSGPRKKRSNNNSNWRARATGSDNQNNQPSMRRFHSSSRLDDWPNQAEMANHKGAAVPTKPKSKKSSTGSRSKYRKKTICNHSNCCCGRELRLKNRPPLWNEQSQVYQLDFGGRVTQESAKNLQIDFEGHLALQFGRVDRCTYTLDYKYPFNAVQAMSIALASLTQRLK